MMKFNEKIKLYEIFTVHFANLYDELSKETGVTKEVVIRPRKYEDQLLGMQSAYRTISILFANQLNDDSDLIEYPLETVIDDFSKGHNRVINLYNSTVSGYVKAREELNNGT